MELRHRPTTPDFLDPLFTFAVVQTSLVDAWQITCPYFGSTDHNSFQQFQGLFRCW